MKKMSATVITTILLTSSFSMAAQVISAKIDSQKKNILIDVSHGGGCGEHSYSLKIVKCLESMPVQCEAKLVHTTNDFCEAMLYRTAVINIEKSGLSDEYYKNAKLTITGDNSNVSVILPSSQAVKPATKNAVQCTTHTGSKLVLTRAESNLTMTSGLNEIKKVVSVQSSEIETFPVIFQDVYNLEDGRSIIIEFKSGKKIGTGQFLRKDGSYSPQFNCSK